jgi:AcrR family transcriptional regulator
MVKQRDANKSKKMIISSAMNLFAKDGYDGVSMDLIAKNANINKAMIYYYFKNKAKLYEVVVKNLLDEICENIDIESKNCTKPIEELKSFIFTFAKFAKENPYLPSLMLAELSTGGKNLPEEMFAGLKKIFLLLNGILKRGEEKGCFNDIIPILIHFMIIGTINLFITTKELRVKVGKKFDEDVCNSCDIEEVAEYIFRKMQKMLKKGNEC